MSEKISSSRSAKVQSQDRVASYSFSTSSYSSSHSSSSLYSRPRFSNSSPTSIPQSLQIPFLWFGHIPYFLSYCIDAGVDDVDVQALNRLKRLANNGAAKTIVRRPLPKLDPIT